MLGLWPNFPVKTLSLDTSVVKHSTLLPTLSQSFDWAHQGFSSQQFYFKQDVWGHPDALPAF